jgi:predicted methyltransferase MtxX (methanogen marker protein 4)
MLKISQVDLSPVRTAALPATRRVGTKGRSIAAVAAMRGVPVSAIDRKDPAVLLIDTLDPIVVDCLRSRYDALRHGSVSSETVCALLRDIENSWDGGAENFC